MRKSLISVLVALTAVAAISCTKEPTGVKESNLITEQEVILEATIASSDPDTKTVRQSNGAVFWSPKDSISLFYGSGDNGGNKFTAVCTEPSAVSNFTGTIGVITGGGEITMDQIYFWGVYPYSNTTSCSGGSIYYDLPSRQVSAAGSFSNGQFPTMGRSHELQISFYNICGGIRFTVANENIMSVTFRNIDGGSIAGRLCVTPDSNGLPVVSSISNGSDTIEVTPEDGNAFIPGVDYYVVIPPVTMSSSLEVTYKTLTTKATKTFASSITITRSVFSGLTAQDNGLTFVDNGADRQEENIVFADPAAKFACVAKFDTDGDGEVTIKEAEAATSFDGLFTDWKGVKSFDEISYFKNVHSISGLFNGCTKLVSITIPENITDLGTYAFNGCASLTSVELPSGITSIGNYTFSDCEKLISIGIPSKVTLIGDSAFSGCSSLTKIGLPSSITSLGNYAFLNCSKLVAINMPSKVTSIGFQTFYGCSSLTQIVIPEGITSLPNYCFSGCSSLVSIDIPSSVTSIGSYAFSGVSMWKLELPSSIKYLGSYCFGNITCVVLPSTSPVSIQSNAFSKVKAIYVPSNLIEMYKAMTYWTKYSNNLYSLNLYKDKMDFISSSVLCTSGAVDMGNSVRWAAYNVGASKPEEFGDYYAWGETETKSDYSEYTYFDSINGNSRDFTKYYNGEGGKTVLDPDDDVAHVQWGGKWRMPTYDDFTELRENCIWEWTTYEGINGYMVYGFKGNRIFLPAAGIRIGTDLADAGSDGYYWSSSLYSEYSYRAWFVFFFSGQARWDTYYYRHVGLSVRPVCE